MEEALRAYLLADAAVSAIVGPRASWGLLVQNAALPSLRLTVVSRPVKYAMGGAAVLSPRRIQIDAYGKTYSSTKGLFRAINTRLGGSRGPVAVAGLPVVEIRGLFLDDERDAVVATKEGVIYSTSGDFEVWAE